MKQIFIFLTILVLCSCDQQNKQTRTSQNTTSLDSGNIPPLIVANEKVNNKTNEKDFADWKKYQDSLRNKILNEKKNKILKESFLQELYIRNVAKIFNDSVKLSIPFNLHGPDCGAPDCYSTDISFSIKLGHKFTFPQYIPFTEHEHGCVSNEQTISGIFKLIEESKKLAIYYSEKHKRTLVLFSSYNDIKTTAFYFTGLGEKRINGQNVFTIMKEYNDADKNSIFPFTSWVLTTSEYEFLLY